MRTFSVDVSAVKGQETQEGLLALIEKLGYGYKRFDRFWGAFFKHSNGLPEGMVVFGDLSIIVAHADGAVVHVHHARFEALGKVPAAM